MSPASSRQLNWAVIALAVLWFAALAPGHPRGVIALPGSDPVAACCPVSAGVGEANPSNGAPPAPSPCHDPTHACAICQLIATLAAPAHLEITLPPLDALGWHRPQTASQCAFVRAARPFDARPPPALG